MYVCMYVCIIRMYVCVCVCVRLRVRVCVRARVRLCRPRLLLAVKGACHAWAVDYDVQFATGRYVLVFEHA